MEPPVENSGIPQGKLMKRQRLPKNDIGDHYTWKDINLGQNLTVYGRVFRVIDSDEFTKQFLESEGVVVNAPEVRNYFFRVNSTEFYNCCASNIAFTVLVHTAVCFAAVINIYKTPHDST